MKHYFSAADAGVARFGRFDRSAYAPNVSFSEFIIFLQMIFHLLKWTRS